MVEIQTEVGARWLGLNVSHDAHWDIDAGQHFPVIRSNSSAGRHLDLMRWGIIAAWLNDTMVISTTVDCHAEICETALRYDRPWSVTRRCLIPSDGLYEWRTDDHQSLALASADRRLMTLGGIWEQHMSPAGNCLSCFAILVAETNGAVAQICRQTPVVIPLEARREWLGEETSNSERIMKLLVPYPSEKLIIGPLNHGHKVRKTDTVSNSQLL